MQSRIGKSMDLGTHGVVILDSLDRHGVAPRFPDRRRLSAIHYGGDGRSPEAGLYGDVIPSWCAALHAAFSASSIRLPKARVRSSSTCTWHWVGPPHSCICVRDHVLDLTHPGRFGIAHSRTRLCSLYGSVLSWRSCPRETHAFT